MFFQVTLILFFLKLMLIGLGYIPFLVFSDWQAKPRPPDKPGSLALIKDRNNYREGCSRDLMKAIGGELVCASLQAQEEKVRDLNDYLLVCRRRK